MTAPVVKRRWVAAATTASATSCGSASRLSGVREACSSRQPTSSDLTKSVSARPGETYSTRIAGATARASDWVMLSTAALDAQ